MRLRVLELASLEKHHLEKQSMSPKMSLVVRRRQRTGKEGLTLLHFCKERGESGSVNHWPLAMVSQLCVDYVGQLQ